MSNLVKATLQKILADEAETPDGEAFPVQFNPASLKLRITNQIEGGQSTAKQVRQQTGNSSRTLSLDLVFDTADEGTTATPVSVRDKTKQLEQFISTPENNPDPPPKLKFHWGDLTLVGIAESIDISLEHFASNGYPLRAKVSLSIKEQDPRIQFQPSNRGSGNASAAGSSAGQPGAGTNPGLSAGFRLGASIGASLGAGIAAGVGIGGGIGIGASIGGGGSIGLALEGELGAEFAARVGADPAAWRALQGDLTSNTGLTAGAQVGFNQGLTSNPGIGKTTAVNAKESVQAQAASALNVAEQPPVIGGQIATSSQQKSLSDGDDAGKAMASLGGIAGSINRVKITQQQYATDMTLMAFDLHFANSVSRTTEGQNDESREVNAGTARQPLVNRTNADLAKASTARPQPPPAEIDPRATSFGRGVPLQPLFNVATEHAHAKVYADRSQHQSGFGQTVPTSNSMATPLWKALPQRDRVREQLDSITAHNSTTPCNPAPCGCLGVRR